VRLLLPILDPEHAKEYGWEREHNREEWLALFREKVGDDADHWYFLCPRHWLYHRWLHITMGIEDYISYYIWQGFCWHAPWDQIGRLFIRNPKGGSMKILIVGGDDTLLSSIAEELESRDFQVLTTHFGDGGLSLYKKDGPFAFVLTDHCLLPGVKIKDCVQSATAIYLINPFQQMAIMTADLKEAREKLPPTCATTAWKNPPSRKSIISTWSSEADTSPSALRFQQDPSRPPFAAFFTPSIPTSPRATFKPWEILNRKPARSAVFKPHFSPSSPPLHYPSRSLVSTASWPTLSAAAPAKSAFAWPSARSVAIYFG
jgi:hypothetical protein